jgi:lipopolysaccharide/colanic/teichoic acid biosynthesis glycosyltransferase
MYRRHLKRGLDLLGSTVALLVLAPALAGIALAVLVADGRPVLFKQMRPGVGGRPFALLKFRTMRQPLGERDRDSDAARLTRLGRCLRATSLDELPELWNVWRGEMSLVGPRPLLMEYLRLYTPAQARRHEVRPGITGWAQIHGRNELSWERKFELDVWYVDHVSFALDVRILLRSVVTVVSRQGIALQGHATSPRFTGSESGSHNDTGAS